MKRLFLVLFLFVIINVIYSQISSIPSSSGGGGGSGYATVENDGSSLTQRNTINVVPGTGVNTTCADDSGNARTNCEFSADTAIVQSLANDQSGAARLCSGSASTTATCAMTPTLTAYTAGMVVEFIPGASNTSTYTLNIDSLGAKSILTCAAGALSANDIVSGRQIKLIYDGTQFRLPCNPQTVSGSGYDPFTLTTMQGSDELCHPIQAYNTGTTTGLGVLNLKVNNGTGTGTINSSSTTTAQYPCGFTFGTGGTSGDNSYLSIGGLGPMIHSGQSGSYEWILAIPTITTIKVSVGIGRIDYTYPDCWDTAASNPCFAVTFDTTQSDTNWMIRECDAFGTNCSTTDTSVAVVAGRIYRVRLAKAATTATVTIVQQNDGTSYTSSAISWNPSSAFFSSVLRVQTATNAARTADIYRVAYSLTPATRY